MTLQVGVKIFLKNKEGKYLLVKRSSENYKGTSGNWDIVGGRIEPGSTLIENLKREVEEETNLQILSEPILICAQDIILKPERHIVRLSYVGNTEGIPVLDTSENTEYKWLSLGGMKVQEDLDIYVSDIVKRDLLR